MTRNAFDTTRRGFLLGAAGAAASAGLGGFAAGARAAAPMLGVSRPQFYRFKLGEFEVAAIKDGAVPVDPSKTFGLGQPPEVVAKHAADNLISIDRGENPFTPTLVNTGKELVLFDTGNGAGRRPAAGKLLEHMAAAGYSPEQVDIVVITHGHPDHINGLTDGGKPAFPNARYVIGEIEHRHWKSGDGIPEGRKANRDLYLKVVVPFEPRTTFISPDGEVVPGIRAVNAFGHSHGHMAYHIESGGRRLLIWGDTANHYVFSVQRPEWHVSPDHDKEAGAATRKRLLDMAATDRIPVVGYHLPPPAVGYVEKTSGGYRWVPASYQLNL